MPERTHHPSGPLGLAIALAASAGFVDAHIYVNVTPVFVANMSGNLIHLGILLGGASWHRALATLLTLAAFTAGVIAATIHHDRRVARARPVRPTLLLLVEGSLLVVLALYLWSSSVSFTSQPQLVDYPVLLVAGLAMGLQAAALRRVGQVAVATTYGTGTIVRIGEKVVLAARRADRTTEHRRRVAIAVLVTVLVSYIIGAIAATAAGDGPAALAVPGVVVVACAVFGTSDGVPSENDDEAVSSRPSR
ncbi:MAG: DUF1275 domain-containing protein [Acidimicrobiales bacterium]|nr:DUF1275 domain-containing protein [Acidimicrobiales bacterium]HRW38077.1 YoaK family protein [Aquihabitans sp.]